MKINLVVGLLAQTLAQSILLDLFLSKIPLLSSNLTATIFPLENLTFCPKRDVSVTVRFVGSFPETYSDPRLQRKALFWLLFNVSRDASKRLKGGVCINNAAFHTKFGGWFVSKLYAESYAINIASK